MLSAVPYGALVTLAERGLSRVPPEELPKLPTVTRGPAAGVLLLAGVARLRARAGRVPPTITSVPAAAVETLPSCPLPASQQIAKLVAENRVELLVEPLAELARRGRRIHPAVLPLLLGSSHAELQNLLRPVLGARGAWLAGQNPAWAWALPGPPDWEKLWEEGSSEQRIQALRATRVRDPMHARLCVQKVWASERPELRFEMLETLQAGLSRDDEPFLELCLDDRSAAVRHQAAALLAGLPGSELAERMWRRGAALVRWVLPPKPDLLQKLRRSRLPGPHLDLRLPTSWDPAWARDGVVARRPAGGVERNWWALQIFSVIPPDRWCAHLGVDLSTLLGGLPQDPVFLEGLTNAARHPAARRWRAPLWEAWAQVAADAPSRAHLAETRQDELLPLLPTEALERLVVGALVHGVPGPERAAKLLRALPMPWGRQISTAWLDWLETVLQHRRFTHFSALLGIMNLAARRLHPDTLGRVPSLSPPPPDANDWIGAQWSKELERLQNAVAARHALLLALEPP